MCVDNYHDNFVTSGEFVQTYALLIHSHYFEFVCEAVTIFPVEDLKHMRVLQLDSLSQVDFQYSNSTNFLHHYINVYR